ncbi:MAG TPA: alkyl sulfatase dimerization domain-containing protein [Microthrixaceae bacterium]|nr:alkyl sulfatase dimerization domain-containing protein [Microthrixaceae bacterium]
MSPDVPSEFTNSILSQIADGLPMSNRRDFEDSIRGLIAPLPDGGVIKNADGGVVWDLGQYDWVNEGDCPASVHPSLHRQTQLLTIGGLFEVCERVYQVRSADISNMDIIEGDTGVILVDPLTSPVTARAALELYFEHRGRREVKAVVITHSHVDHYGGIRGVVSDDDVESGRVQIIVPAGFTEAAVSENVLAGNVMTRRAAYMYGMLLPKGPTGTVSAGLGLGIPFDAPSFMIPTDEVKKPVESMVIDGVEFTFMLAPDTEAPAEMLFHLPQFRALCSAEDATHTLHNLYTLRGAKTRDAKAWAYYINKAIDLFGADSDIVFAQHHWPRWGNDGVIDFLESQRDAYKYLHDQTLRLANQGETMLEIAEQLDFPDELGLQWHNRSYYGSISHNAKSVYNLYLGWFDANPATLHELPPVESSVRYVDYMGGAAQIMERAKKDFDSGEYRWVAQVLNHVVFADPANAEARELLAATFTQLGYQTENAVWRNFYLTGAQELRNGVLDLGPRAVASPDTLSAMTVEMMLDLLSVQLNGPAAAGRHIRINLVVSDTSEMFLIELRRSVLHGFAGRQAEDADLTLSTASETFKAVATRTADLADAVADGRLEARGDLGAMEELLGLLDEFKFWFNIIEP